MQVIQNGSKYSAIILKLRGGDIHNLGPEPNFSVSSEWVLRKPQQACIRATVLM